jgi:hypothetical protein
MGIIRAYWSAKNGTIIEEYSQEVKNEKYKALEEINRVCNPNSTVLITKYPNRLALEKLYNPSCWFTDNGKIYDPNGGHKPSERARPQELYDLVSDYLEIKELYPSAILPQKTLFSTKEGKAEVVYTKANISVSQFPLIKHVAQCYNILAQVPE